MSKRQRQTSLSETLPASIPVNNTAEEETQHPGKYTHLDASGTSNTRQVFRCALPPHEPLGFDVYEDYEVHYHKTHVNRCIECGKNFPTDHFLSLHIAENHDPLTAARRERGDKTYQCFVEGCEKVCGTWQKRRMHLVDKHMFPRNYDFFVVNDGIDRRGSLLRQTATDRTRQNPSQNQQKEAGSILPNQGSTVSSTTADQIMTDAADDKNIDKSARDMSMDDIADSMAALKFVPKSVTFGRGRQRGGLAKS